MKRVTPQAPLLLSPGEGTPGLDPWGPLGGGRQRRICAALSGRRQARPVGANSGAGQRARGRTGLFRDAGDFSAERAGHRRARPRKHIVGRRGQRNAGAKHFSRRDPLGKLLHLRFGVNAGVGRDDDQPRLIVGVVADVKSFGPAQQPDAGDLHLRPATPVGVPERRLGNSSAKDAVCPHQRRSFECRKRRATRRFGGRSRPGRLRRDARGAAAGDPDRDAGDSSGISMGSSPRWPYIGRCGYLRIDVLFGGRSPPRVWHPAWRSAQKRAMCSGTCSGQGLVSSLAGIGIGIAAGLGLTRFLSTLLFEVKPQDPLTFLAVSLVMMAVALLSCYVPARRATTVDPAKVLRAE